jgi:hypothetical protein
MTRIISLVDLDDTLFQTLRKCPLDVPAEKLTPIGFQPDGTPLSFATPRQFAFINWLVETTLFVPVTARSLDALKRVKLPFDGAICAHGGMILGGDGTADRSWEAYIRAEARTYALEIKALAAALVGAAKESGEPVHVRVQCEGDVELYPLARHETADEAALQQLPEGWTDHRNSNVIAFLPPFLGKQHAVAYVLPTLRARFPDAMVLGIGDSITDAPFMGLCDFAMTPKKSQLARAFTSDLKHS